ncbi:MAG: hypothetical protein K0R15_629 [Clostridiales bacterium]|jgi:hypothetical protein|nr:hypothetical protein [Clostridiales bacterium]
MKLSDIRDILLTVTPNVHHFKASKQTGNYIVWAEDGQGDTLYSENKMQMQVIQGTIDYFTTIEFDPTFDVIQETLNNAQVAYSLNSIQHEEETGYIHYEWVFEVDGGN